MPRQLIPFFLLLKSFMFSHARKLSLGTLVLLLLALLWMPGLPHAQSSPTVYSLPLTIANQGVAFDTKTNLIVATDYKNNVVQLINFTTAASTSVAVGMRPVAAAIYTTSKKSYAYIGNEDSNTVSVVDLSTKSVIQTIPVGQSPASIAINSSTGMGYVANFKSDNVSIMNLSTNTVAATTVVGSEPASVAINTSTKKIYVANSKNDTISVIDGTSNAVTATIPVGQSPMCVVVNSDKSMAYSVNSKGNSASAINLSTNVVTATIPVGSEPVSMTIDAGTNTGYVANLYNDSVSVINLSTNTVTGLYAVGRDPIGVAYYSPYLIVATERGDGLWVINTTTQPFGTTVPVGKDPDGIAVDPTTNRAMTANEKSNDVSIVDLSTAQVIATIPVGGHPKAVAINSETQIALVANEKDDTLAVIDLTTKSVIGTIVVGKSPVAVAINPSLNIAATANRKADNVSIVDISNHGVIGTIAVGKSPSAVAIQPTGNIGVAANRKDNTISILDLSNRTVIATIPVGKDPAGVAIDSDLNLVVVTNNKDNTVSLIDLNSEAVGATVIVGKGPRGVGINPSTHQAAIANFIDDTITVIDLHTRQVVQTLSTGKSPEAVAINPNTNQAVSTLDSLNLLTILQLNNPVPIISGLVPVSISAGEPDFTLTVEGSRFITTSIVEFNGQAMDTQFVSATKLTASIPAAAIMTAGTVSVIVTNPAPVGGASNSVSFAINNPVPILTNLVPAALLVGNTQGTLTINGQKFVPGAVVSFAGQNLVTTFVNSAQLSAIAPATLMNQAGLFEINVINPGPGGGPSNTITVAVNNPVPTVMSIAPTSALVGTGSTALTVNGSNFIGNSTIQWNGTSLSTTYVSAGQMSAAIPANLITSAGTFSITVANPAPGGGPSNAITFTINNPTPAITSIIPTSALVGSGNTSLTVNGSNFIGSSTIQWNGTSLPTTYVSAGQMSATIPANLLVSAGSFTITVANPFPGGGTSNAQIITINIPAPTIANISPTSVVAGSGSFTLTVSGTNFLPSSIVMFNGQPLATTFVSSTQLTATVPASDVAGSQTAQIVVSNQAPGGGESQTISLTVSQPASNVQPLPDGSFGKQYEDLVPSDATIAAYTSKRFAIVTGLVNDRNGNPISDAKASFLGHPEYGTASTDSNGRFNLPVDGGGTITVVFEKTGLITSHRQVNVPWNNIINAETITLIAEDTKATTITFDGSPSTVMIHTSTMVSDDRGPRSLTMVFTGDNRAVATDAGGQQTVLTSFTARGTEFDTPENMPAKLPSTSAYTYCAELSVDGARSVKFDKPVTMYVDNFLGFNVGAVVPVGYYDRDKGIWIASHDGVVVRLLDTNSDGIIDAIDNVGDGLPHDYNVTGLADPTRFKPNATYWQVKVDHFTPWDCNWPYGPPSDAIQPNPGGNPAADQLQNNDDIDCTGSYCERRNRILHEDVPIPGTDMMLHYASNRVQGLKTVVTIPASGSTVPASLTSIVVRMEVAGRVFETVLPSQANQKAVFIWDGTDYLGRPVFGSRIANISIGFGYKLFYYSSEGAFNGSWANVGNYSMGVGGREGIVFWKYSSMTLKRNESSQIVGGWTLSGHHYLSPSDPYTLIKSDGTTRVSDVRTINTIAGKYQQWGFSGDGGPATQARLGASGVAVDKAGNIYIADKGNHRIRKIDTSDIITTIAGNGLYGFSGDGGPAVQAMLNTPINVAVDNAGNIYIADSYNHRIRKVDIGGIITTVAGNGQWSFSGDGGPAVQAGLDAEGVAVDNDGNIYIADSGNNRIRKVNASGIITTVAGNSSGGYNFCPPTYDLCGYFSGDGGPAVQARLASPQDVAVDNAGNIYIADTYNYRIRKVNASGIITTVAGSGPDGLWHGGYAGSGNIAGDGGTATMAKISCITGVAVDTVGNIYIADTYNQRIRKVDTSGMITTIAGSATTSFSGDGGPATQAGLLSVAHTAVDPVGNIFAAAGVIRKISSPDLFTPYITPGDMPYAEENGLGYVFSNTGLHKSTIDLASGKTLLTFGYNANNQLVSIKDRFRNETTIQRDGSGAPVSITSPDGQVTGLTVDSNNYLTQVTYSDGSSQAFSYTPDGLLTDEYDKRGNHFVHQYDSNGKITDISDPEKGHWNYTGTVDSTGTLLSNILTGEGNLTTYRDRADSTGAYKSIKTDPSGEVTTNTISSDGLAETTISSCGLNRSMSYGFDSLYQFKYLTGDTTRTPAGLTKTVSFSKTHQDTNGDTTPDRVTDTVTKNSNAWVTVNNTLTGVVTATSPKARTVTSQYDPTTLLTQQITVPGLYPAAFIYDTRGRLVSTTTGSRAASVTYDPQGNIGSLTDALGSTMTYSYDSMNRLTGVHAPNSDLTSFGYDANGNMTVLTNPKIISNGFDYTGTNLRMTWTTPLSGSYQYTYDKEKKLKTITFPSGKLISNIYTSGRLSSTTTPEGTINYNYGCGRNLSSVVRGSESASFTYDGLLLKTDARAGTVNQAISYNYNNAFNLSSITYAGTTQNFGYDNDGLLISAGLFTISRNSQNGLPEIVSNGTFTVNRIFSGYGEMDENTYTINSTPLYDWTLTRDKAGRITQKIENMQESAMFWDYGYDSLGRLIEVKQNNVIVESYTYDVDGNRLTEMNNLRYIDNKTYTYSNEDHVITAGSDTYQFDQDGFLTSKITSAGTTTYNYSSRGELLNVTLPDGTAISNDNDPMGRRIAKRVNGTITEKYLWQGMTRLLAVYDGSNNLVLRFTYAEGRMPVSMTKGGVTYYLFYDQVGSLRAVVDSAGAMVKEVLYDSYGSIIYESNPSFAMPFGFAGGLYDRDTGLVRFGARDYDSSIGKWTAKDPNDFAGGDVNLFGYVGNNPVNWIDPYGLAPAGPPPVPVPGGGPNNGWKWNPNPNNSRGGTWGPQSPIPGQGQPSASWDPLGHWDVDNGLGNRNRCDAKGNPLTPEQAHGQPKPVAPDVPWWAPFIPDPFPIIINPCVINPSLPFCGGNNDA